MHWRRKWQPTPVFLPGESQGRGSLVGCRLWGRTGSDTTEATQQQQQQHLVWDWLTFYSVVCFAKFGGFSAIISLSTFFFQLCPVLPLFIGYMIQMLDLLVDSHRSLRLCSFPRTPPPPMSFLSIVQIG